MKRYYAQIEAPDNLKPRYNKESVDFFFTGEEGDPEIITTEMIEGDGWHGLDETPKEGDYILISFANYTLPDIGRYEDGVFYPGDDEKSYKEYGLIVNGWQKLPKSRGGRRMIESRSMCNECPECRQCGRKFQKYKALICDYCHGEVEKAALIDGEHVCDKCLGQVLEYVTEDELNG